MKRDLRPLAAALLALAWVGRKDEDAQPLAKPFAVLGLASLLAWCALLASTAGLPPPGVTALADRTRPGAR